MVALSGALMPGPVLTVNIAETAKRGFWAGPAVVLGHGIAELVLLAALCRGLSELLEKDIVTAVVGIIGGLVLLWMGIGIIRGARHQSISMDATAAKSRFILAPVWAGMLATISNPYWLIWWATIGASYVLLSLPQGIAGVGYFFSGHILADLLWYALISAIVATGRRIISDAIYRGILIACGIFLIGLAGYFFVSGLWSLF